MFTTLIGIIITIAIIGLIVYCIQLLPLPEPFKTIIWVLVIIGVILYLASLLHGGSLTI